MKFILVFFFSLLLLSCSKTNKSQSIEIANLNGLNVKLVDTNVLIHYKGENIYTSTFSNQTHIIFNSKRDLLFINDSCFSQHNFEGYQFTRYKWSSSNLRIDIEKYNDSLLLINNYILSEINLCDAMESIEYLGYDSLDNTGNTLYSVFIPKAYNSNIYNTKTKKKVFELNVAKINFIEDLIVLYKLEKQRNSDWGDEYMFDQNIYMLGSDDVKLVYSTNKNNTVDRELGYIKLLTFSEKIDSISFFNNNLFFLYKNETINLYKHEETAIPLWPGASLPIDKKLESNIDSIKVIPFYKNAFISFKGELKYLNFVQRREVKSHKFDKVEVKNYLVRGKNQYSDYEITIFSLDSSNHIISQNSYYTYSLPEVINTLNPLDSLYSEYGILDTIPINTLFF